MKCTSAGVYFLGACGACAAAVERLAAAATASQGIMRLMSRDSITGAGRCKVSASKRFAINFGVSFPDSFSTERLRAERLVDRHFEAIRAMDSDPEYMSLLGGTRDEAATRAYLARNLKHWDDYGFGLWMLRDVQGEIAGRCVLRHLDVEGTDEVELGYGLHTRYWGR